MSAKFPDEYSQTRNSLVWKAKRHVVFDDVVNRAPGRFCIRITTLCNVGSNKFETNPQQTLETYLAFLTDSVNQCIVLLGNVYLR